MTADPIDAAVRRGAAAFAVAAPELDPRSPAGYGPWRAALEAAELAALARVAELEVARGESAADGERTEAARVRLADTLGWGDAETPGNDGTAAAAMEGARHLIVELEGEARVLHRQADAIHREVHALRVRAADADAALTGARDALRLVERDRGHWRAAVERMRAVLDMYAACHCPPPERYEHGDSDCPKLVVSAHRVRQALDAAGTPATPEPQP